MTAREELKAHLSSWEYAYAMSPACYGASSHPALIKARERADELRAKVGREQRREAIAEAQRMVRSGNPFLQRTKR